jgi:hypothetical protein
VAGLRLVCRQQTASTEPPFDEATLKAINKVLGLPESHDYLVTCNAGASGKYVANGGQPSVGLISNYLFSSIGSYSIDFP